MKIVDYLLSAAMVILTSSVHGQTNKPITLDGIPFGVPGMQQRLEKLCSIPSWIRESDRSMFCNFRMAIPFTMDFNFEGIIGTAFFKLALTDDGTLNSFEFKGKADDLQKLVRRLEAKYGRYTPVEIPIFENNGNTVIGIGLAFQWRDKRGTQLTVNPSGIATIQEPTVASLSNIADLIILENWRNQQPR